MPTAAQIRANQANAQLSTGPRTPEGKARSSANSRKEGFSAAQPVVYDEQMQEFIALRDELSLQIAPVGALEDEFFNRLLTAAWNLRRVRHAEMAFVDTIKFTNDDASTQLYRLARYRRDLERSFDRALTALRELQAQRIVVEKQPESPLAAVAAAAPLALAHPSFRPLWTAAARSQNEPIPTPIRPPAA